MRLPPFACLLGACFLALPAAVYSSESPASTPPPPVAPKAPAQPVWQATLPNFSEQSYEKYVEDLIETFEKATHRKLVPGAKKKVGLKIYTDSGPGMATPVPL